MNILQTILMDNAKQTLLKKGITGTYTFDVTVADGIAKAITMIDGAEFFGYMPVTEMMSGYQENFSFTVTV